MKPTRKPGKPGLFATPAGAVTEISGGFYKVAGNATDTETAGPLVLKATGTGSVPAIVTYTVEDLAAEIAAIAVAVWGYSDKNLTVTPPAPVFDPVYTRCTATVLSGETPVNNAEFVFKLVLNTTSLMLKQIYEVTLTAHTNALGILEDDAGNPYFELQRTDHITPAGSYWTVTNSNWSLTDEPFHLTGDTFNLHTLV
jgi:hypothetical protein